MTLKQLERKSRVFQRHQNPVTTTSAINYFTGFFVCWRTKFLPLRVSSVLLQLIHISLQVITIRSSPSQTTGSQHVTLLKQLSASATEYFQKIEQKYSVQRSYSWFFQPGKSYKSYSCTCNLLHIIYKFLIKSSTKTFKSAVFSNCFSC